MKRLVLLTVLIVLVSSFSSFAQEGKPIVERGLVPRGYNGTVPAFSGSVPSSYLAKTESKVIPLSRGGEYYVSEKLVDGTLTWYRKFVRSNTMVVVNKEEKVTHIYKCGNLIFPVGEGLRLAAFPNDYPTSDDIKEIGEKMGIVGENVEKVEKQIGSFSEGFLKKANIAIGLFVTFLVLFSILILVLYLSRNAVVSAINGTNNTLASLITPLGNQFDTLTAAVKSLKPPEKKKKTPEKKTETGKGEKGGGK